MCQIHIKSDMNIMMVLPNILSHKKKLSLEHTDNIYSPDETFCRYLFVIQKYCTFKTESREICVSEFCLVRQKQNNRKHTFKSVL